MSDGYVLTSDGTALKWQEMPTIPDPDPKQAVTAKCPCCGSRQFQVHASRRICSYCRSEQDGQAVSAVNPDLLAFRSALAEQNADSYREILYSMGLLRPEVVVRVPNL